MISEKDIYLIIEQNNAPYVRIYDTNKTLLHRYEESDNVPNAIAHLKNVLPMYSGYGKVIVNCADADMKKRNWAASYYLTCFFDKTQVNGQFVGGTQQQFNGWNIPNGFISNEVMIAKLEKLESDRKHEMEMFKLQMSMKDKEDKDPLKQIERVAPWVMYGLGKTPAEIGAAVTAMRIGNANTGTNSYAAPGALTFKDVEALPKEEKEKKFQVLADSVQKKVSIEEMTLLFDAIDKNPDLVKQAIDVLPLLKK